VAYGGTGVTASSGANSVMLRDANQNVNVNRLNQANTDTAAAGGTTTLTAASTYSQTLTGTGSQTFTMPDATTLTTGVAFVFNNNATGTLTLANYAATTIGVIPSGGAVALILLANGTTGGTWNYHGFAPENIQWGTNSLYLANDVITGGTWNGGTIGTAYGGTGLTSYTSGGAVYANSSSTLTSGTLPVTAGGTGATTAAGAQSSLNVPSTTGSGASGTWGISITGSASGSAGSVANAATFNSGGAGDASGTTFNGSAARTISYNTIGAPSTTGTNASGTWGINVTGTSGSISGFNNPTTAPTANTIAYRTADGDIAAREIILSSGLQSVTPTVLVGMYPTTNQLVRMTPAAVAAAIQTGATGTWAINISGNAATATTAANYLPLTGGTLSGDLLFSNSGLTKRGIMGTVGDNDYWFVGGGATASNTGFMEIATGDDGQTAGTYEPIYASQYGPGNPLTGTLVRRASLLDANGNTTFPGSVGINVDPAARLHVRQSTPTGLGGVPAGVTMISDSSTNNYLLFRNTADNGTYAGLAFQDNNMGGYVVFGNSGATPSDQLAIAGYSGGILQYGTSDSINPAARTTAASWNSTGLQVNNGDMRAPIYYDSNNTAYYVDPASTSILNTIGFNGTSANAFGNYWAGAVGYPAYQFTGGNSRFGFSSTSGYVDVYTDGNYYGGIDLYGASRLVPLFDANQGGGALYSSIIYDSNNTAFYLDPNGTSVLNILDAPALNDSRLYLRTRGDTNHYLWNAGDDWEELVAYSGTGFRVANSTGVGAILTCFGSDNGNYVQARGSMRAPIFYDSDNTGYYADFSSTAGDCARFAGGIVVSQGNVTGNGIILADDGDIVDLNDGYCSMRFSFGVRIFSANRGGSAQVALTYQGNVIAAGNVTAYGSPSDIRLKENIQPLTGALNKVMQLQGCTFDWKEESEEYKMVGLREDIGFIADAVQDVVPTMVREGKDGYLSLRDRGFSALLVEAMKEQQAQIAALRAEINALRAN
jgi:hypothetical protein